MNILVGDSGASKTDWVLINNGERQFIQTDGLNPHLMSPTQFMHVLAKELKPNLKGQAISKICFYGAGCGSLRKKQDVVGYLKEIFEFAEVTVKTDLDGAGIALFEEGEGVVCVLGTGSNAGFFSGGKIVEQMPSFGYPHGDEGSGSHIGKKLLIMYLQNELHKDLRVHLEENLNMNLDELFMKLQTPESSKLFVSKVGEVLSKKSYYPEMQKIIYDGFAEFLQKVKDYFPEKSQNMPLGFVGSIASMYEGELRACAKQMDLEISSVIRSPIEHIAYHFSRDDVDI